MLSQSDFKRLIATQVAAINAARLSSFFELLPDTGSPLVFAYPRMIMILSCSAVRLPAIS
jgi:hypothetical protein